MRGAMPRDLPAPSDPALAEIIAKHLSREGPLLPILHDVQAAFGHIPAWAIAPMADALNLTAAEVHGVVSFYHDFRKAPAGRHVVKICRAEACQAMGGAALAEQVLAALGTEWHGTSAAGVTVEPVYCLGLCACAPAAMVDGQLIGRAEAEGITAALAEARP